MMSGRGRGRGQAGGRGGPGGSGGRGRGRGGPPVQVYAPPGGQIAAPDARVRSVEDAIQKASSDSLGLERLKIKPKFPRRPGYGSKGAPVTLWANYVQMLPSPELVLYRYNISTVPEAKGKKGNQLVKLLLDTPDISPLRPDLITDFKSTLISRQRLPNENLVVDVQYKSELEDDAREDATIYRVRVQYTNTLRVSELIGHLSSTDSGDAYNEKLPLIQALNVFVNHYSMSAGNLARIGASKSFSLGPGSDKWDLGAGLVAIRGFYSSVRAATSRILVNVNVSHGAFYIAERLDQLMQKYQHESGPSKLKLQKFLKRLQVKTTHLPEKRNKAGQAIIRVKPIFSLAATDDGHGLPHPPRVRAHGAGPKDVEFWLDGQQSSSSAPKVSITGAGKRKGKGAGPSAGPASAGRYISVFEFFRTKYPHIQISNPSLPVINVGNREKPTYLPAEVCVVMPGQGYKALLDPRQTQQMIRFAVRRPWANAASIVDQGLQTVGLSAQANVQMGRWGISVSEKLIAVQGRVLNEPKVVYRGNHLASVQSASWNMLNVKFNTTGLKLNKWSYLLVSTPGVRDAFPNEASIAGVVNLLHGSLLATGVLADKPVKGRRLLANDVDDPAIDDFLKLAAANLELLFVVLPTMSNPLYPRIKRLADVKYGIHTICSVGEKLANPKGQDQYLKNLALKFNMKLGGTNQFVDNVSRSIINEGNTMVVGIDVTHPSPGSSPNAPSVAGMVASIDKSLGQWPATAKLQSEARKEEVDNLNDMLKRHLNLWKTKGKNQSLPQNILVYRDGVSEGQYDMVINQELSQLRQACTEVYPPPDQKKGLPRFTVIIVGKRHNTRFYPTTESSADKFSNPKPGTVVDRGVTEARNWDFFMQPHAALQGTARPAHYFVLLDEIFQHRYKPVPPPFQNIADIVEDLTYGMSYGFGRATKAVSVCPPAKYADMVCERVRCYLQNLFNTPTSSVAGSVAGSAIGMAQANNDDIRVHARLRDTMFYI